MPNDLTTAGFTTTSAELDIGKLQPGNSDRWRRLVRYGTTRAQFQTATAWTIEGIGRCGGDGQCGRGGRCGGPAITLIRRLSFRNLLLVGISERIRSLNQYLLRNEIRQHDKEMGVRQELCFGAMPNASYAATTSTWPPDGGKLKKIRFWLKA